MSMKEFHLTEEEWRKKLTPQQYRVLREQGTEPAFQNEYWNKHEDGTYCCAGCGAELFRSAEKYDSGSGWPSFWEAIDRSKLALLEDRSHGMVRVEVRCARCGGHLGHLFDDGPNPTGERFCMNSASLEFQTGKEGE